MHFLSLVKTCFLGQFSMKFLCWKLLPSMLLLLMLLCLLLLLLLLLFAALSQKQNTHKIYIKVYLLYIQKPRKSSSHVYNFIHLFIHSKFCNMQFQLPLSRAEILGTLFFYSRVRSVFCFPSQLGSELRLNLSLEHIINWLSYRFQPALS